MNKLLLFFILSVIGGFLFYKGYILEATISFAPIVLYFLTRFFKKVFNFFRIYRATKLIEKRETDKGIAILKKIQDAAAFSALGTAYDPNNFFSGIGDSKESFKWFHKAAEKGHVVAQLRIAEMYFYGQGVEQSNIHAYLWLTILAEYKLYKKEEIKIFLNKVKGEMTNEEIAEAEFEVSHKFATGTMYFKNYNKSEKYLFKSAENGNADSMLLLVLFYSGNPSLRSYPTAKFFSKNDQKAQKWSQKFVEKTGLTIEEAINNFVANLNL